MYIYVKLKIIKNYIIIYTIILKYKIKNKMKENYGKI